MLSYKPTPWFTICVLFSAFLLVAFTYMREIGLDEPAPVGTYLNDVFPTRLVASVEVASEPVPTDRALAIAHEPLGTRIFVAEQVGRIYTFLPTENGLTDRTLFMNIRDQVFSGQDSGMLGLAFHPEYNQPDSPNSTYFYVYYTAIKDSLHFQRLSRFSGTTTGDTSSEFIMFEQELGPTLHRGGGLLFGADGFLYLSIGDLGYMEQSQNITDMLSGGILRIDVDMKGGAISHAPRRTLEDVNKGFSGAGYYIPSDNPFVDESGGTFEEYYALGSRNPHRMTIDRETGTIYIGNAGSNEGIIREEVNVLAKGANYGWPFREGTIDHPEYMARPDAIIGDLTDPIHEYPKADGDCAVIGGYVYRGSQLQGLYGKYIFADYCSKRVWAMDVDEVPVSEKEEIALLPLNPYTFGEDVNGELYVGVEGWNPIYKLNQPEDDETRKSIPTLLSETGAFSDLSTLTPASGVIPYDIIAPLWSDGAEKLRWVAIPNDGSHDTPAEQIAYNEEGEWAFPQGTVFVKHFEIALDESNPTETRRLETRFLVHGEEGLYYAFTYRWNEAETDATLIVGSVTEELNIRETNGNTRLQTWYYPGQSDCLACHTPASGYVLGPKTRQLNSDIVYPVTGRTGNQLESLNYIGAFTPAIDVTNLPYVLTSKNLEDDTASLEERVRSYLDANCASCHRPGGGTRSQLDLRLQVDLASTGLINGDPIETLGIEGAKIIAPGNPSKSILLERISQVGTGAAMPPLAKDKLDTTAVKLIREWITTYGVDVERPSEDLPPLATLHTNYPNPFHSSTRISYELSTSGHVSLNVYDMQGRKVRVLVDEYQPAGRKMAILDGSHLASGAYIYQLSVGDWQSTKQLVVVR